MAGIVEGALLIGWRLTQVPRSRSLEFLLVSPMHPGRVFLFEALVGLAWLSLVTLAGMPILILLAADGLISPDTLVPLLLMPLTWGALTGLVLTIWAYELLWVRRWGERLFLLLLFLSLVLGVLGAEKLPSWTAAVWPGGALWIPWALQASLDYNPFGAWHHWYAHGPEEAWPRALLLEGTALAGIGLLLGRGAARLLGHFNDRHYQPLTEKVIPRPRKIGNQPLAWWAVGRVTQFSGRINLWLAGGFGLLYALYTLAGPTWPSWLGRVVFIICDGAGGIPALTTGLVILAAVPAAFQYGLWDASVQDRCRRLELLLLTALEATDYWQAAAAAAWRRGRGYLATALVLWGAALFSGQIEMEQVGAALAAAVLLWCFYFALGFRAFSRGVQANGLGLILTLGLPLAVAACWHSPLRSWVALLPPGSLFGAQVRPPNLAWAVGPLFCGLVTLVVAKRALARCEPELRRWYELHHGRKVMN
jgi:hypothetical protein